MLFDGLSFSPRLIQARWTLDKLPSEELPSLAQDALEAGFDGRNVRRLAGLIRPTRADLLPLMPGFLEEIGISNNLTREEAAWLLARLIAKGIFEGKIGPYPGARFIGYEIVNEIWPNQQHQLLVFEGLASDYEDCQSYSERPDRRRREIEQKIVEVARESLMTIVT